MNEYVNINCICGYGLMAFSLVINIFALSRGVNVKDIPIMESLSYLFVPVMSSFFLKEHITKRKIFAIGVIISGVIVFLG
jgi:drug/metabolite transporter (DMT)-like permease